MEIGGGGGLPVTYVVSIPRVLKTVKFPVIGCPSVENSAGQLRDHFMYRYFLFRIAVVQEGKEPLPLCDVCGMHIPAGQIIKHQQIKMCGINTQMRWRRREVVIAS